MVTTLCGLRGCEEVNNRGQHLVDLILKNDFIVFNDKSHNTFIQQVEPSIP